MDKFGIFQLINSFYDFYNKTKSEGDLKNSNDFTDKNSAEHAKNSPTPSKTPAPLQEKMLSVMNSHDKFVKSVMEKNKKP